MIKLLLGLFFINSVAIAQTTEAFKIDRYLGNWHEIYSLPNRFQKDCYNVTAEYSLNDNGTIKVVNTCRNEQGQVKKSIEGEAILQSIKERYLKVYFFRPLGLKIWGGDYYVLSLEKNYNWAIVGTPDHKYGWILSRKPSLSKSEIKKIQAEVRKLGFDWSVFNKTSTIQPKK